MAGDRDQRASDLRQVEKLAGQMVGQHRNKDAEFLVRLGVENDDRACVIARINNGWSYVLPEAAGRKGVWFRIQDGTGAWVLPADASELQTDDMTPGEQQVIYDRAVSTGEDPTTPPQEQNQ